MFLELGDYLDAENEKKRLSMEPRFLDWGT